MSCHFPPIINYLYILTNLEVPRHHVTSGEPLRGGGTSVQTLMVKWQITCNKAWSPAEGDTSSPFEFDYWELIRVPLEEYHG